MITKLLAAYDKKIENAKAALAETKEDVDKFQKNIDSLVDAIEVLADYKDAQMVLEEKRQAIIFRYDCAIQRMEAQTEVVNGLLATQPLFVNLLQENCKHNWVEDGYDYHNNDQEYKCSICGCPDNR